jgi:HEAT repeat protein
MAISAVLLLRWLAAEPQYEGRPLSAWVHDIRHGSGKEREKAADAIRKMGPEGLPYLAGTLTNPPSPAQRVAKSVASRLPDRLKQQLRRFYNPPNELATKLAVLNAVQALGTNGVPAVDAVMEVFLREPNLGISTFAGQTLGHLGTNSLPALITALDHADYNIRSVACHVLASLHTNAAPAVPRLERIARDEIGPISSAAFYTLSRIGNAAVPSLTELLSNTNSSVRSQALYSLNVIGPGAKAALPAILKATQDPEPEVRARAIEALFPSISESPEVSAALSQGLVDTDPRVRAAAATVLGSRPRFAYANLSTLIELLKDDSPEVRSKAAFALGRVGHRAAEALPYLETLTVETNQAVIGAVLHAIDMIQESSEPGKGEGNAKMD